MNTVDVRQAQATVAADRDLILRDIEASVGADKLNAAVSGALLGAFSSCEWPEVVAAACGDGAALTALASAGAAALDVRRGHVQQTALHAAAGSGFHAVLTQLLAAGADPMARNVAGRTPLHRAAEGGHLRCVRVLLASGSLDVDVRDNMGNTPLYMAAAGGQLATFRALAETGADLRAVNNKRANALHTACGACPRRWINIAPCVRILTSILPLQ